ncbi:MAG: hypothetical protein M1823_001689 [Watsoniomyces obsoletus]|nr:MAG: hypothetical protein M1823_001689 [Watsoniomyces obsoletus]
MPPKRGQKRMHEDSPSSSDTSSGHSEVESETGLEKDTEPVETLIAGRAKRATAGNRLSTLLDREAEDDELELLFAEDEEDEEFEGKEDEEEGDVRFESSSDDDNDDHANGEGGDGELEGERQLQRETRAAQRISKRKTEDARFKVPKMRSKVKKEPTTENVDPKTPAPKLKSRGVRLTEGATRSSTRTSTVQNKEVVLARVRENEERRLKLLEGMEKGKKKRAATTKKEMTQEERMEEARKTEILNSKSLNRWEESEKKRAEDEKARLKALKDRRLHGPVVTWYSGRAEWGSDGKIKHLGRKRNDDEEGEKIEVSGQMKRQKQNHGMIELLSSTPNEDANAANPEPAAPTSTSDGQVPQDSFLDGLEYYATLRPPSRHTPVSNVAPDSPAPHAPISPEQRKHTEPVRAAATTSPAPLREISPPPNLSTRNLVILDGFDPNNLPANGDFLGSILMKKKTVKPQKTIPSTCRITDLPARYRFPGTLTPYRDMYAYKAIKAVKNGRSIWSSVFDAFTGSSVSSTPDPKDGVVGARAGTGAATGAATGSVVAGGGKDEVVPGGGTGQFVRREYKIPPPGWFDSGIRTGMKKPPIAG